MHPGLASESRFGPRAEPDRAGARQCQLECDSKTVKLFRVECVRVHVQVIGLISFIVSLLGSQELSALLAGRLGKF